MYVEKSKFRTNLEETSIILTARDILQVIRACEVPEDQIENVVDHMVDQRIHFEDISKSDYRFYLQFRDRVRLMVKSFKKD